MSMSNLVDALTAYMDARMRRAVQELGQVRQQHAERIRALDSLPPEEQLPAVQAILEAHMAPFLRAIDDIDNRTGRTH